MRSITTPQSLLAQWTTRRTACLFILGSTNPLNPNLRLRKRVHHIPIRRNKINTNRIRERRNEKKARDNHAKLRAVPRIRRHAQQRRYNRTTTNRTNDPTRPALRVLAETTHSERNDGREDDRLKKECDI